MMGSPHLLAGAAIGAVARRPWLAYPLALASHIALDMVPHYDSHDMVAGVENSDLAAGGIAVLDFVLAWWLILLLSRGQSWRRVALWSAALALSIDLAFNLPLWGPVLQAWSLAAGIGEWHHAIQPHLPPGRWLTGFGPQVLVLAVSAWVLLRQRRLSAGEPPEGPTECP